MAMTDDELRALVDSEFESAMGNDGGDISQERALALDYYLSKELGNEIEGQSQVVSSDVSDVVDSIMPSLLRIFTTAENLVGFDAVSEEDVPGAEQESDYVNYVFFKQNPAFSILYTWFFDSLVQKNGIVKAWWDDSEIVTQESYQGLTEAELFELLDDDELEPIERAQRQDETVINGEVVESTVHDIEFRRVSRSGRARVDNVPPEEYRISADARSLNPSDARFVGQEREVPRSELIEMGFDPEIVDELPSQGQDIENDEDRARKNKSDETNDHIGDRSQQRITLREAYVKVDKDDDGRSELRQVFTAAGRLLSDEAVDRQPFHVICPQPLPHKHFGRATAEKVMDIQKIVTTLIRQNLDNLYHTNNPEHAVWEQALGDTTLDDLRTRQAGKTNLFSRPVNEAWQAMTVPYTAGQSFPMIEFFEKSKKDRTGISSDSEGLSPEALKNIQTSVLAQSVDLAKMKVEAIARIFAETGIKSLFLHIHELLMKHQEKEQVVQLRNQWVPVNPQQWRTRLDMTVNIGLGIGTREQNLIHLNDIWAKQGEIVQNGGFGLLVTPKNIFNTAAEIVKNANLKQPTMFFTDPGDQVPEPQEDETTDLAEQQLQIQAREQELNAQKQQLDRQEAQLRHEREIEKLRIQQQEADTKRQDVDNDLLVAMENIKNKITELELKFTTDIEGGRQ